MAMTLPVDLWHVRTDAMRDAAAIEACARMMAPEEHERHRRLLFEEKRHELLVTRGLARSVLSTYVGRPPGALVFHLTEYGQPLLEDSGDLRFNLTNTPELVACAVTRARDIGVDAEPLSRAHTILRLAPTVFTPYERDELARLPSSAQPRRAVELWTLKEAYMKARGLGMKIDPSRIELTFAEAGPTVRELETPPLATTWSLVTHELEAHLVSVCVACEHARELDVRLKRFALVEGSS